MGKKEEIAGGVGSGEEIRKNRRRGGEGVKVGFFSQRGEAAGSARVVVGPTSG
jgi:hypothetical protein